MDPESVASNSWRAPWSRAKPWFLWFETLALESGLRSWKLAAAAPRQCVVRDGPICVNLSRAPNPRTNIMDFRGFDSSIILILRRGISRPIGKFPESLTQAILVGVMFVGRLGLRHSVGFRRGASPCSSDRCTALGMWSLGSQVHLPKGLGQTDGELQTDPIADLASLVLLLYCILRDMQDGLAIMPTVRHHLFFADYLPNKPSPGTSWVFTIW